MGEGERNPAEARGPDPARGQTGYESAAFWLSSPKISDQTPAAGSFCMPRPSKPHVIRVLPRRTTGSAPAPLSDLLPREARHELAQLRSLLSAEMSHTQSIHGTSTDGTEYSKSRTSSANTESNSLKISSTRGPISLLSLEHSAVRHLALLRGQITAQRAGHSTRH